VVEVQVVGEDDISVVLEIEDEIPGSSQLFIENVAIRNLGGCGVGVRIYNRSLSTGPNKMTAVSVDGFPTCLELNGARNWTFDRCWFVATSMDLSATAVKMDSSLGDVNGMYFSNCITRAPYTGDIQSTNIAMTGTGTIRDIRFTKTVFYAGNLAVACEVPETGTIRDVWINPRCQHDASADYTMEGSGIIIKNGDGGFVENFNVIGTYFRGYDYTNAVIELDGNNSSPFNTRGITIADCWIDLAVAPAFYYYGVTSCHFTGNRLSRIGYASMQAQTYSAAFSITNNNVSNLYFGGGSLYGVAFGSTPLAIVGNSFETTGVLFGIPGPIPGVNKNSRP
jgi:hypothetical protein